MNRTLFTALAVLAFARVASGADDTRSPAELVRSAEQAMHANEFDQALEFYQQAREQLPNNAEIPYNMAVAQFRKGEYQKAGELFEQSISLTDDAALRARGTYNLGTAAYAQSLAAMQGQADPAQAKQSLENASTHVKQAIEHFKQAIDANPSDEDAKANAEMSQRLLTQLQQMQEQMQQQQPQQQQGGEQSDDQQQQQQSPSTQPQSGEQSPQSQPSDQSSENQSEEPQDQPQEESEPSTQPEDSQATQPQQSNSENGEQDQQEAEQQEVDAEAQDSPQTQPEDQGELAQTRPADPKQGMTRQAAERLLQAVRDKERKRREELARRERARYKPADKDW